MAKEAIRVFFSGSRRRRSSSVFIDKTDAQETERVEASSPSLSRRLVRIRQVEWGGGEWRGGEKVLEERRGRGGIVLFRVSRDCAMFSKNGRQGERKDKSDQRAQLCEGPP